MVGMKKIIRTAVVGVALVLGLGLAGCSSNGHSEQESFSFSGDTLNVVHNNSYMDVTVTAQDEPIQDGHEVTVEVTTQTLGQSPEVPAWSLSNDVLNLGTPCGGSVVGYCEGSYVMKVPAGTEVLVNGQPTAVR